MFMTCVEINRLHYSARQALADCCDMHRNIMRLFASDSAPVRRNDEQVLYRVIEQQNVISLYITSKMPPNLQNANWLFTEHCRQRNIQPVLDTFAVGQVLAFDLLTHPSKKIKGHGKNSARVFLKTSDERLHWMIHEGEKHGFRLMEMKEDEPFDMHGRRYTGKIILRIVRMRGRLQITDAELFAEAYQNGIGPEKAYGLGMLLLSRGG